MFVFFLFALFLTSCAYDIRDKKASKQSTSCEQDGFGKYGSCNVFSGLDLTKNQWISTDINGTIEFLRLSFLSNGVVLYCEVGDCLHVDENKYSYKWRVVDANLSFYDINIVNKRIKQYEFIKKEDKKLIFRTSKTNKVFKPI